MNFIIVGTTICCCGFRKGGVGEYNVVLVAFYLWVN